MIFFQPGSHAYRLITVLAVSGEFPTSGLHLFGSDRVMKALVHNIATMQDVRNMNTGEELRCRLISISGKGGGKTIRLHRSALPILNWIHPQALESYLSAFYNHRFPGDTVHKDRNHRTAEVIAMCLGAGVEFRPYMIPELQNRKIQRTVSDEPALYCSRDIKRVGGDDKKKIAYSRLVGVLFARGNCFAVYNMRNAFMKWDGRREFKVAHSLMEITRLNADVDAVRDAVLFGKTYDIALRMLDDSDETKRTEFRFDNTYYQTHFIPQTEDGVRQLRLLMLPNWREKLLSVLFDDETRSYNHGRFEYDAIIDGEYVLSFLDSDIARLARFKQAAKDKSDLQVLCFPHQVEFLQQYLPKHVGIRELAMDVLEEALGIRNPGGVV